MSQKNETLTVALSFLITLGVAGGGFWLVTRSPSQWNPLSRRINPSPSGGTQASPTAIASNAPIEPNAPPSPTNLAQPASQFSAVSDVPSGLFNYGGSTTWAPIRRDVDEELQEAQPRFRLRHVNPTNEAPGSGTGIRMLLNNQLAFSQSSRPLKDEEYSRARQRGFTLQEIPVAIDGIAIAVHPSMTVPGLTIAQLKDIYTSKITNWQQVGGPDLPIKPYSRRLEAGGAVEFFFDNVLGKTNFGPTVEFIPTTTLAIRAVARNPGGIYYASAPEVVPQCTVRSLPMGKGADRFVPPYLEPKINPAQCPSQRDRLNAPAFQTGDYPITRRLFVIVKQNGQSDQAAGEAYARLLLTDQGQQLIEKSGFIPIR